MVKLGVGKNMVSSIRYWAHAFNLIEQQLRGGPETPTSLGTNLLGTNGWDPYLEDAGTLWLLHWQLVRDTDKTSTWHLAFSRFGKETFSRVDLLEWLQKFIDPIPHIRATTNTLKRDVDVFIRTYLPSSRKTAKFAEDSFDSPLVELGLLHEIDADTYRFSRSARPTLSDLIFTYALVDYWDLRAADQRTLGFETLLHGKGSPGMAFKLTENALAERLERLAPEFGIRFDDTAGMRQLLRTADALPEKDKILAHYYKQPAKKRMTL